MESVKIKLTLCKYAIIDKEDYERVMSKYAGGFNIPNRRWYCHTSGKDKKRACAARRVKGKIILMHRFILNDPKGMHVHHINGDTFDNRKENLEILDPKTHLSLPKGPRKNKTDQKMEVDSMWTAKEVHNLRKKLKLSKADFSRVIGVSPAAVHYWESGHSLPSGLSIRALNRVRRGAE